MANYNKVILVGNLTRDPQLSYLPSQTPVCEFGLAVNRRWRGQNDEQREEEVCTPDEDEGPVLCHAVPGSGPKEEHTLRYEGALPEEPKLDDLVGTRALEHLHEMGAIAQRQEGGVAGCAHREDAVAWMECRIGVFDEDGTVGDPEGGIQRCAGNGARAKRGP